MLTIGRHHGASKQRWLAAICACAWLLYALAIALAPLPVLAQSELPSWASDVCSQSHTAPPSPTPDHHPCPHALCCLLGCGAHHGAPALPPTAATLPQAADQPIRFTRTASTHLPTTRLLLLADPRGPPATVV